MKEQLRPFLVSAPLTIDCADVIDTNTIYIFDYENSFINEENKPQKLIAYLESLGSMFDIYIADYIHYEDKEKLLLEYFNCGSFMNVYTLVETMIHCLFVYKDIKYKGTRSIFTDEECQLFIHNNKEFIEQMIKLYDSLFVVMLMFSGTSRKDIKSIKNRYSCDQIIKDELSPNVCSLLLDEKFYRYYNKHISSDIYYYEFLFENNLYKGMSFEDVLNNDNNNLLPLLIDLNNEDFLNFIKQKKES